MLICLHKVCVNKFAVPALAQQFRLKAVLRAIRLHYELFAHGQMQEPWFAVATFWIGSVFKTEAE